MKKQLLSAILAAGLLLSTIGCSEGGSATPGGSGDSRTEATTSAWTTQSDFPATATPEPEWGSVPCGTGRRYDFDSTTMTVNGIYENTGYSAFCDDFVGCDEWCFAAIFVDGEELDAFAPLEAGMVVQVYCSSKSTGVYRAEFHSEYAIREILRWRCGHRVFRYDHSTMTVETVWEGDLVEGLLGDSWWQEDCFAVVLKGDEEVKEGLFEVGMVIRVYCDGETLDYAIREIGRSGDLMSPDNTIMSNTNYVLPICGVTNAHHGSHRWNCRCSTHNGSHSGIDIARASPHYSNGIWGVPVRAIEAGIVETAEFRSAEGWIVVIRHGGTPVIRTTYMHMHSLLPVKQGDTVTRGQVIGYVADTGSRSFGSHLHFEISSGGGAIDPLPTIEGASNFTNVQTSRIELRSNGGTFSGGTNNPIDSRVQNKTHNVPMPLIYINCTSNTLRRTGFTFVGWGTAANSTVSAYLPDSMYTANSATTLHAMWLSNTAPRPRITFDLNGGNFPASLLIRVVQIDGRLSSAQMGSINGTTPSRPGHRFVGWFTTSSQTGGTELSRNVAHTADTVYFARWAVDANHIANGTYMIKNRYSEHLLDVSWANSADGTQVWQWRENGDWAQHWIVERQSNGTYSLTPRHAQHMRLDIHGLGIVNNTKVNIWRSNNSTAQRFRFIRNSAGFYFIEPSHAPGMVLRTDNCSTAEGAHIVLWENLQIYHSQHWEFVRIA
jgi:uncharacterized repeat protein (TIGR02543 family)